MLHSCLGNSFFSVYNNKCDMYKILVIKIFAFKMNVKVEDTTSFLGVVTSDLMFLDCSL